MSKYIDADKLITEIERRIVNGQDGYGGNLKALLPFINSLQQEQPEVDLEKEMDRYYDSPLWDGENVSWMTYTRIARHFYELGKTVRKEE